MEKSVKKTNKVTLIAAALIISGATAVFGTYAASDEIDPTDKHYPAFLHQQLTDEQKEARDQAHELFQAGDVEGAKAILDTAGLQPPIENQERMEFIQNLTDEQKEMFKNAHELMQDGDFEGAKAIFDELGLERPENRQGLGRGFRKGLGRGFGPNWNLNE